MTGTDMSRDIVRSLSAMGYTSATGVPCSLLKNTFSALERGDGGIRYTVAPREDSAVGWAAGQVLAGEKSLVLMQNSGLGYSLNSFTSFTQLYGFPLLVVVSWRGHGADAVEHDIIGARLTHLLDAVGLPWRVVSPESVETDLRWCDRTAAQEKTTVVAIVRDQA